MKILKPYFYDEFKCTGGECIDTCCAGWRIVIDETTLCKYDEVNGDFGLKLRENINREDKNSFKLNEKHHCPFLNKELLCDIYIELGEDMLCNTCKIYPRVTRVLGDITEQNLLLSCPEISKLIVENNFPMDFEFKEIEESNISKTNQTDFLLLDSLLLGRSISVEIMQNRTIEMWKRCFLNIIISQNIQKYLDNNQVEHIKNYLDKFQNENYLSQYLNETDMLKGNSAIKLLIYKLITYKLTDISFSNENLVSYVSETFNYLNQLDNQEGLSKLEELIVSYKKGNMDKEYVMENFIVYNLFDNYMPAYDTKNLHKNIIMIFYFSALIELFQMVRWYNKGEQITDKERIDIIYLLSRTFMHITANYNKLYDFIKEKEFDTLPYLLPLIR